jgi:hypothetical protein
VDPTIISSWIVDGAFVDCQLSDERGEEIADCESNDAGIEGLLHAFE